MSGPKPKALPAPGQSAETYTDPFAYCAAVGTLDTQQRRLGQLVDHPEPTGRAPGQAAQGLLGILQIGRQAGSVALGAGAAVDRVGACVERVVTLQQRAGNAPLAPSSGSRMALGVSTSASV